MISFCVQVFPPFSSLLSDWDIIALTCGSAGDLNGIECDVALSKLASSRSQLFWSAQFSARYFCFCFRANGGNRVDSAYSIMPFSVLPPSRFIGLTRIFRLLI
jgi:hypothetical protein